MSKFLILLGIILVVFGISKLIAYFINKRKNNEVLK